MLLKARGIDGQDNQVLVMKEIGVQLENTSISHQFLVVGIRNTCILGADFLKLGGMIVDILNGKLSWPTGETHICS